MRRLPRPALLLLPLWLGLTTQLFGEMLLILPPAVLSPDTPASRDLVSEALRGAAQLLNQRYGNYLTALYEPDYVGPPPAQGAQGAQGGQGAPASPAVADYTTATVASLEESDSRGLAGTVVVKVKRRSDGRVSEGFPVMGRLGPDSARHLAGALFHQWASFHDYLLGQTGEGPVYVDELPLDSLSRTRMGYPGMFAPMSVALTPGSTLLVGTGTVCLELDRHFRLLAEPGRSLYDAGQYGYALGVAVTPAGSIFFKNFQAGRILRWLGEELRPQSWNVGTGFMGAFAALSDGSVVAAELGMKQAVRLEGKRREALDLLAGPNSFISALAAGPEGELWVWDMVERRIRIYTPQGRLLDSIVPLTPQPLAPASFCVLADGSFVAFAQGQLWRFRRDGVPQWRTAELAGPLAAAWGAAPALQNAYLAADSRTGLIFLADPLGRRLIKLLDRQQARRSGALQSAPGAAPVEDHLVRLNGELARAAQGAQGGAAAQGAQAAKGAEDRQVALLSERARIYEELDSIEMAQVIWEQVLEIDPSHPQAAQAIERFELSRLRRSAAEAASRTRKALEELGPESARQHYTRAMQLFEQLMRLAPADPEATEARGELKRRFEQREGAAAAAGASLEIGQVRIEDLFPSLQSRYAERPVGSVSVKNATRETLRDLRASVLLAEHMDFATEGPALPALAPGATASLELRVLLNTKVFELQEDLPVLGRVEVSYTGAAGRQAVTRTVSLTLFRRTALVWDETAKLASFVTPNEETVSSFAQRALAGGEADPGYRLSARLLRAARVCDTLGAYTIAYVEDPDSPISEVLGKAAVVDTVRFPRMTLEQRTGDCDDTTALLASLLEAVGVRTALMTCPGHVFLAFDTGEPAGNLWLFTQGGRQALAHGGSVWLPVETTLLSEGFPAAWQKAGELLTRYRGKTEFLPLADLRGRFPALPLPPARLAIIDPPRQRVQALTSASMGGLEASLYRQGLAALQERLTKEKGARALAVRNQIGVLHARFGQDSQAEQELRRCLSEDPAYVPALLNLANLKLVRGELEEAAAVARQGLARDPAAAALNLLMALYYNRKGELRRAGEHLEAARRSSPELAERYAYLGEATAAQARAGLGEEPPLSWPSGAGE